MKGELFPDYYVTCGICNDGEHVAERERSKAKKSAHALGYVLTKRHGWVCKRCASQVSISAQQQEEATKL